MVVPDPRPTSVPRVIFEDMALPIFSMLSSRVSFKRSRSLSSCLSVQALPARP